MQLGCGDKICIISLWIIMDCMLKYGEDFSPAENSGSQSTATASVMPFWHWLVVFAWIVKGDDEMISYEYIVSDKQGLHAINALRLSKAASEYESRITLKSRKGTADCKNVLSLI